MTLLPFVALQAVIFIALVVALRRILSRNVTAAAAHLQGLSAEYTRRQEELSQRLEESERQYGERITRAKTEAERIVVEARQEAESSRAKLLEEARLESERIVKQGMESRDALRKELEREMERRAVERACELIQKALPMEFRRGIQERWLDELFRNGFSQFDRLKPEDATGDIRIVSALPLTNAQRDALRAKLKEQGAKDVTLTEETDESLVAGLTVTIGSLVLDGSLSSKIREAVRHATEST